MGSFKSSEENEFSLKKILKWVGVGLGALVALVVLSDSYYKIDEGEVGINLIGGRAVKVSQQGYGFKYPIFETVSTISTRSTNHEYEDLIAYSIDAQEAKIDVKVLFSVPADKAMCVYKEYLNVENAFKRQIDPAVRQAVKAQFGLQPARAVINNYDDYSNKVEASIKEATHDACGIVHNVSVTGIDFDPKFKEFVTQRNQAETNTFTQEQNLKAKKTEAEIALAVAIGQGNRVKQEADAEAYRIKAEADSKAYSVRIQGEAIAAAAKAQTDVFKGDLSAFINYQYITKWNGMVPSVSAGDKSGFLLSLPAPK